MMAEPTRKRCSPGRDEDNGRVDKAAKKDDDPLAKWSARARIDYAKIDVELKNIPDVYIGWFDPHQKLVVARFWYFVKTERIVYEKFAFDECYCDDGGSSGHLDPECPQGSLWDELSKTPEARGPSIPELDDGEQASVVKLFEALWDDVNLHFRKRLFSGYRLAEYLFSVEAGKPLPGHLGTADAAVQTLVRDSLEDVAGIVNISLE